MRDKRLNVLVIFLCNVLVLFGLLSITEIWLFEKGYIKRQHSWVFQNEEFIQEGEYRNFFTLDAEEIFRPRENTVIQPGYWATDQYGFRTDPTHEIEAKGQKILLIGDSFAYGHGVSDTDAWPFLVEQFLNDNGVPTTLYNAAVPATGTDQQYVRLHRLVKKLSPDKVLWMISFNDMADSNLSCLFVEKDGKYLKVPGYLNIAYINAFTTKYFPAWFTTTRVGNALTTLSIHGKDLFTAGCSQNLSDEKLIPVYFRKLAYLLTSALELSARHKFNLIIVFAPTQTYMDRSYANNNYEIEFTDYFIDVFKQVGVEYVLLNPEITKRYDPDLYAMRTGLSQDNIVMQRVTSSVLGAETMAPNLQTDLYLDESPNVDYGGWHMNEKGNRIIADIVFRVLYQ